MDRIRDYLGQKSSDMPNHHHEYAPLQDPDASLVREEPHKMTSSSALLDDGMEGMETDDYLVGDIEVTHNASFSWLEYLIFLVMGIAMLWSWNMFLAASPYFSIRLSSSPGLQSLSQSAITSVFTVTNLTAMAVLVNMQYAASYPFRINTALLTNIGVLTILTASTFVWTDVSAGLYFGLLLVAVAATAWAAGLMQNGAFAFAASFGRPEYMQAIMTGQALAGVLPSVTQMAGVALVPSSSPSPTSIPRHGNEIVDDNDDDNKIGTVAFVYFFTAVLISLSALFTFQPLVARHNRLVESRVVDEGMMASSFNSIEEAERVSRKVVGMLTLWNKLRWLSAAVFACFAVAMFFPVFTSRVVSIQDPSRPGAGLMSNPSFFISLAFFFWNLGDLLGRMGSMIPYLSSLRRRPRLLMLISLLRIGFLPLYLLCNIDNKGAILPSDWHYLLFVQLPFGLTNGWLGSTCMMGAGDYVDENEREAAGGFMGFSLVAGLTVGSLMSFGVA